jgi:energy-coupling factor transporter transmembrane protein EcfT
MIFGVCIRFVPLLLSFGLTVKDATLSRVYWFWSENASLKHTIFDYVLILALSLSNAHVIDAPSSSERSRRTMSEEVRCKSCF